MGFILRVVGTMGSAAFLVPLLKRIAVAIGLSVVSYAGFGTLMTIIKNKVITSYSGLPADVIAVLALADVDKAISVILSAYAVKITMIGLDQSGVLKKVLLRPNQQGTIFG